MNLRPRILAGIVGLLLLLGAGVASAQNFNSPQPLRVRCLLGLPNIKHNSRGRLMLQGGAIHFDAGKHGAQIPVSSIEDVFTGSEMTEVSGIVADTAKGVASVAPYDSGAALAILLREKVDVLTVNYRDSSSGLHAAIFALPEGQAVQLRTDLIAERAETPTPVTADPIPPSTSPDLASNTASLQTADDAKPSILIEPVIATLVTMPAAFQMAIYEDLTQRAQRSGLYRKVYRSGDRAAEADPNLLTLRTEVDEFKEGSQTVRELFYIFGETKIALALKLTQRDGIDVINQHVVGKVLFFGENLGVTQDVAKRVVKILRRNAQASHRSSGD